MQQTGVVSATASPAEIEAAVAAFLDGFVASLDAMTEAAYARNVAAAVANRLVDDHNLGEEAARYFSEIEAQTLAFDRAEVEAAAMQAVPRPALATWARGVLLPGGALGRRLSVHIYKPALPVAPTPGGATGSAGL